MKRPAYMNSDRYKSARLEAVEPPRQGGGDPIVLIYCVERKMSEDKKSGAKPSDRTGVIIGFEPGTFSDRKGYNQVIATATRLDYTGKPTYSMDGRTGSTKDNIKIPASEVRPNHPNPIVVDAYYQDSEMFDEAPETVGYQLHVGSVVKFSTQMGFEDNLKNGGIFALSVQLSCTYSRKKKTGTTATPAASSSSSSSAAADATTSTAAATDDKKAKCVVGYWFKYSQIEKRSSVEDNQMNACLMKTLLDTWSRLCYTTSCPIVEGVPNKIPSYYSFVIPFSLTRSTLQSMDPDSKFLNFGIREIQYVQYDPKPSDMPATDLNHPVYRTRYTFDHTDPKDDKLLLNMPLSIDIISGVASTPKDVAKVQVRKDRFTFAKSTSIMGDRWATVGITNRGMLHAFMRLADNAEIDSWIVGTFVTTTGQPHAILDKAALSKAYNSSTAFIMRDIYIDWSKLINQWGVRISSEQEYETVVKLIKVDNIDPICDLSSKGLDARSNALDKIIKESRISFINGYISQEKPKIHSKVKNYYVIVDGAYLSLAEMRFLAEQEWNNTDATKLGVVKSASTKNAFINERLINTPPEKIPKFSSVHDFEQNSRYMAFLHDTVEPRPFKAEHLKNMAISVGDNSITWLLLADPNGDTGAVPKEFPGAAFSFPREAREEEVETPEYPYTIPSSSTEHPSDNNNPVATPDTTSGFA